jgi:DNA-binding IclR family transcriptional regulator
VKSPFHILKRPAPPRRYQIKVLEKALAVLDLLGEAEGALTLSEVSERLTLSKPTAFRILSVLDQASYLERAPGSQGYRLGLKLARLGARVDRTTAFQKVARPFLVELKERCGETVHLTVLENGEALYLDKIEGQRAVRVVSRVGMRLPAHCSGVGKVLLAYLPDDEVAEVIRERGLARLTPNTITDRTALRAELKRIRERGFAIDNEEIEVGLKCVAAPIRDASGEVRAALSISGPKFRFNEAETKKLVNLVVRTSEQISSAIMQEAQDRTEPRRAPDAIVDRTVGKRRTAGRS